MRNKSDGKKGGSLLFVLSAALILLTGCSTSLFQPADGPGMVNTNGLLLESMLGTWNGLGNNYVIEICEDSTVSVSLGQQLLLEGGELILHSRTGTMDERSTLEFHPDHWQEDGRTVTVVDGWCEKGFITLELSRDGRPAEAVLLEPEVFMVDGPGSVYEGGPLDEALTGRWFSPDRSFRLIFRGTCADFTAMGRELSAITEGPFVYHEFSAADSLEAPCLLEICQGPDLFDEDGMLLFSVSSFYYRADHLYMDILWPDGTEETVVFSRRQP